MTHSKRTFIAGYPHHILRAAKPGGHVFSSAADYRFAIEELREISSTYEMQVHAFCFLPDKFQLLLTHPHNGAVISTFMKALNARISLRNRRLNKAAAWDARFSASLVEPGHWAMACMAFIERLPITEKLVRTPGHYHFSSLRIREGKSRAYWLWDLPEYSRLGDDVYERAQVYRNYLRSGPDAKEICLIQTALCRNGLVGTERFLEEVKRQYGISVHNRKPGRPKKQNRFPPA